MDNQIKIVIWDLDDTFWSGTLAEGTARLNQDNIQLVEFLNEIGVVNAICSKNDEKLVVDYLKANGLFDLFVYHSVSYSEKSSGVGNILNLLGFRAENAVFIDDNFHNRNEVAFMIDKLDVRDVDFIAELKSTNRIVKGKSRVSKYRQIASRIEEQIKSTSNVEFLKKSNITVEMLNATDVERVEELVQRTNQLNFTKWRSSGVQINNLLNNPIYENKMIRVIDRYGDYGIVGYYCLNVVNKSIVHFVFSCRILGLGVERYIYNFLGRPKLEVVGEVVEDIFDPSIIDWISLSKDDSSSNDLNLSKLSSELSLKIAIRGGCDLAPSLHLLKINNLNVYEDYGNENNQTQIRYLVDSRNLSEFDKNEICANVPFITNETYRSIIFESNFDVIVISLVNDYSRVAYKHKKIDAIVFHEITNEIDKRQLSDCEDNMFFIKNNYLKLGQQSDDEFRYSLECLDKLNINCKKIIFINGAEVDGVFLNDVHIRLNKILDYFVAAHSNKYSIVDMRKIVLNVNYLREEHNIRHYVRSVYLDLTNELLEVLNSVHREIKGMP